MRPDPTVTQFSATGWDDLPALGLSIGCWWDSRDSRMHWFDVYTLEETVRQFVERQPLLVSFNGLAFDFPLMQALLKAQPATFRAHVSPGMISERAAGLERLCHDFTQLFAQSYDILDQIWRQDPTRKFERGLNSLAALAQANGLGIKEMTGAQAPRLWAQGRYAEVLNYCQGDVWKTKGLFELICAGQLIFRGDGQPIRLPAPNITVQEGKQLCTPR